MKRLGDAVVIACGLVVLSAAAAHASVPGMWEWHWDCHDLIDILRIIRGH